MAIMNSCNKHNMIACVEKTERNADFHDVINFLTGCSDTAQVNEGIVEVHKGTAEVNESTAGANLSTEPSMKEVEDEAGPSTFQDESDEFIQDDALIADTLVNITRPRRGAGITIPEQERPELPTLILDPKDKGKGIMKEESKKKKLTLQQLRAAETANDEEVARKVAAE
ncbi:hypothetical protein Tco_1414133, partial [Tanacetum coccineum]